MSHRLRRMTALPPGRIVTALVVAVLAAGTGACGGSPATVPSGRPAVPEGAPPTARPTVAANCPSDSAGGRQVWFTDANRVALGGVELGTGGSGVVLAHIADGDSCEWLPFGRQLAAAGYRVLAFDFAGSGVSGQLTGGDRRDANVAAAAAHLRGEGATAVVLIGASMGANASLVAATEIGPPVAGVVSLSAPAVYDDLDASASAPK